MRTKTIKLWLLAAIAITFGLGPSPTASAYPNGPEEFCNRYPTSPLCAAANPDCSLCHTSSSGGSRNDYGTCIKNEGGFNDIDGAFAAVENKDCDGDGFSSLDEIIAGTFPGNINSKPASNTNPNPPPTAELTCDDKNEMSDWNVCGTDYLYTYRKLSIDFCREPAKIADIEAFKKLSTYEQKSALHAKLDDCFKTEKWMGKDGVVWRLGHTVIGPVQTIKSGEDGGSIPLGDYYDDYAIWMYFNTEGRDVRGILTTQDYVVIEKNPTRYVEVENVPINPKASGIPLINEMFTQSGYQQFVDRDQRAGLLTTGWNLVSRTMFTSTPRSTASAALRGFLGIDIAKAQGLTDLYPKDGNFVLTDYDNKGITNTECAFCHEALDPVTYPFDQYNGLSVTLDNNAIISLMFSAISAGASKTCGKIDTSSLSGSGGLTGDMTQIDCYLSFVPQNKLDAFLANPKVMLGASYKAERKDILAKQNAATEPNLASTPDYGYLFGQKVANLVEWASVAANSDAFARKTALNYWNLLIGTDPDGKDKATFDLLWKDLKGKNNYSINAMLHELIDTEVYNAP